MEHVETAVSSFQGLERWLRIAHVRESLPNTNWMVCLKRSGLHNRQAANANLPAWRYLERKSPGYSDAYAWV
ncbi:hypothetical protein D3C85_1297760 [compost metagenome]